MTRRSRRRGLPQTRRRSWKQLALMIGLGGVALVLVLVMIGYLVLSFYLESDGFRDQVAKASSRALKVNQVEMDPLQLSGSEIGTQTFKATGDGLLKELTVEHLDSVIERSALFDKHVKIKELKADHVVVQLKKEKNQSPQETKIQVAIDPAPAASSSDSTEAQTNATSDENTSVQESATSPKKAKKNKGWLETHFLPERYSVGTTDIQNLYFSYDYRGRLYAIDGVSVHVVPEKVGQEYRGTLRGGSLIMPWKLLQDSQLEQATVRYTPRRVNVTDCRIVSEHGGQIDLEGEWEQTDSRWWASGVIRNFSCKSILPANWAQNLDGTAQGTVKVQGEQGRMRDLSGTIQFNNATLTGLPFLDTLALFTQTKRFRRIEFNEAKADFNTVDGITYVKNIVLASEGLVRVEGAFQFNEQEELRGRLQVGIIPGLLSFIPGSEGKIFSSDNNQGKLGLLWCNVNLSGTLSSPREDLSARLLSAAAPRLGETIKSLPGALIDAVTGGKSGSADQKKEDDNSSSQETSKKERGLKGVISTLQNLLP